MRSIKVIANELTHSHETKRATGRVVREEIRRHQQSLAKAEELKLNQVVQTKLLADQMSHDLGLLLEHFKGQKPEITKREFVLGVEAVIQNIRKLTEVIPSELQALGKVIDKPQENYWTEERLEKVLKKVQPKFPEIKFPTPHKEVRIEDWEKVVTLLEKLVAKPDYEKPEVTIPEAKPFPKKITVDNLGEVVEKLDALLSREEPMTEGLIGLTWDDDSITEIYPSGKVVSSGFSIRRVKVRDDRTH